MNWPVLTRHAAVALLALAASCGVQAQITKCIDVQGNVTYSDVRDGTCRNAVIVDIPETAPAAAGSTVAAGQTNTISTLSTALLLMTGTDAPATRPTAWAALPLPQRRTSTDVATVGAARDALRATDRALASMRTQKLASSR